MFGLFSNDINATSHAALRDAGQVKQHADEILGKGTDPAEARGMIDFDYRDIPSQTHYNISRDNTGSVTIELAIWKLADLAEPEDSLKVTMKATLTPDCQRAQLHECMITKGGELVPDTSLKRDPDNLFNSLSYHVGLVAAQHKEIPDIDLTKAGLR